MPKPGEWPGRVKAAGWGLMSFALVPLGFGAATAALVVAFLEPRWRTAGRALLTGYPENVEAAATLLGVLAAASAAVLIEKPILRVGAWVIAAVGWIVLAMHLRIPWAAEWLGVLCFAALLSVALYACENSKLDSTRVYRRTGWVLAGVMTTLAAIVLFLRGLEPLTIDVYHHGEALGTAYDLLCGGRPFESLIWAHGLEDTGHVAFWILATGELGSTPLALGKASAGALGAFTVFVFLSCFVRPLSAGLLSLAFALLNPWATWADRCLGALLLPVIALAILMRFGRRPAGLLAAGAVIGAAHLYRIDVGLFAFLATLATAAWLGLNGTFPNGYFSNDSFSRFRPSLVIRNVFCVVAGFLALVICARLALGWPGGDWWRWVLNYLPSYHRDAVGTPLPWPTEWSRADSSARGWSRPAVTVLIVTVLLTAGAARKAVGLGSRSRSLQTWMIFTGAFAWASLRSGLGISDGHVVQWAGFFFLVSMALACITLRPLSRSVAMIAAGFVAILMHPMMLISADIDGAFRAHPLREELGRGARLVREHLIDDRAQTPGDTFFIASELEIPENRAFSEAINATRKVLASEGVERVIYTYAAPLLPIVLGTESLTRFYSLGRAYNPQLQRQLIDDLRRADTQALLQASDFGSVTNGPMRSEFNVPIVAAYLGERTEGVEPIETPLGMLWLFDRAGVNSSKTLQGKLAPKTRVHIDLAIRDLQAGVAYLEGWAADLERQSPLIGLGLSCDDCGAIRYGRSRPDVPRNLDWDSSPAVGFSGLVDLTRLDEAAWMARTDRGTVSRPIVVRRWTELRNRSGQEWEGLSGKVQQAFVLGRTDR